MSNLPLEKISPNKYLVSETKYQIVKAVVYAKKELLPLMQGDLSLDQLVEASRLPKVISPVIGMPDIHQGFGLPIGGVMATQGLLSVGAVGMDINCGVRLLKSSFTYTPEFPNRELLSNLIAQIEKLVPAGVGRERKKGLSLSFEKVVTQGINYLVQEGFATEDDRDSTEEYGYLEGARMDSLTVKAVSRAENQLGTLGSGNHFIEILKVEEVIDQEVARQFGLFKHQICVMVHCGSRALGHQTCNDYTDIFWDLRFKYQINTPRKGLAALPIEVPEAQRYFAAMAASVNFAFCNRQVITHFIRSVFEKQFGLEGRLELLYDVAHNIAKWEKHGGEKVLIHRKGATRALPPGHQQNPKKYLTTGHPAIVPGSMGAPSYVLVGTDKNAETFFSVNHGAGRAMSRTKAKKTIRESDFQEKVKGIIHNLPFRLIADEAPQAYKDIDLAVDTLVEIGLAKKVVKLAPLAVIQGH
ncbi:RtcB family protein [Patescibacteria group bacterium]|nr:RtcB family protein [Patescibacteria group bacterium]MBU1867950.1 RtcB family protein [Patescibacteria group bacterium]